MVRVKRACPADLPLLTKAGVDDPAHTKSAHRFHINATAWSEKLPFLYVPLKYHRGTTFVISARAKRKSPAVAT